MEGWLAAAALTSRAVPRPSSFAADCELQVGPRLVIDFHELDRGSVNFDECHRNAPAWAVWLDDDPMPAQLCDQIVNLECHVRNRLDQLRVRRAVPVPLPLDPKGIVQVIAHRHLKMRQRDLSVEPMLCRDSDVVELHRPSLLPAPYRARGTSRHALLHVTSRRFGCTVLQARRLR